MSDFESCVEVVKFIMIMSKFAHIWLIFETNSQPIFTYDPSF